MRTLTAIVATGIAGLAFASCGGGPTRAGDSGGAAVTASPAQQLFVDSCGSCHALAAAGAQGSVGPPLDATELDAAAITRQIQIGARGMPAGLLQGDEASLVAGYVADRRRAGNSAAARRSIRGTPSG